VLRYPDGATDPSVLLSVQPGHSNALSGLRISGAGPPLPSVNSWRAQGQLTFTIPCHRLRMSLEVLWD
jgi:hypothetical protein